MILAGDIGGTSTRLALFESAGDRLAPLATVVYSSALLDRLEDAVVSVRKRAISRCG